VHEPVEFVGWGAEVAAWAAEHEFENLDAPIVRLGAERSPILSWRSGTKSSRPAHRLGRAQNWPYRRAFASTREAPLASSSKERQRPRLQTVPTDPVRSILVFQVAADRRCVTREALSRRERPHSPVTRALNAILPPRRRARPSSRHGSSGHLVFREVGRC
jgi:hypothetical protein